MVGVQLHLVSSDKVKNVSCCNLVNRCATSRSCSWAGHFALGELPHLASLSKRKKQSPPATSNRNGGSKAKARRDLEVVLNCACVSRLNSIRAHDEQLSCFVWKTMWFSHDEHIAFDFGRLGAGTISYVVRTYVQ